MRLYAQRPRVRTTQILADAGMAAWLVAWVIVARVVHAAVLVLAEPGRALADLGSSVSDSMGSAADAANDVPVAGDQLAAPFEALGSAGNSVTGAGRATSEAVGTLAFWLAVVLVVVPVGWLLWRWLPWRLHWAREATAVSRLLGAGAGSAPGSADLELLAARAVATAPLPALAGLPPGTGAAWRAGNPAAVRVLAALEAERVGLALPAAAPSDPVG